METFCIDKPAAAHRAETFSIDIPAAAYRAETFNIPAAAHRAATIDVKIRVLPENPDECIVRTVSRRIIV